MKRGRTRREIVSAIFELRDGVWARLAAHSGDANVRARPFDAIELPLAWLWMR